MPLNSTEYLKRSQNAQASLAERLVRESLVERMRRELTYGYVAANRVDDPIAVVPSYGSLVSIPGPGRMIPQEFMPREGFVPRRVDVDALVDVAISPEVLTAVQDYAVHAAEITGWKVYSQFGPDVVDVLKRAEASNSPIPMTELQSLPKPSREMLRREAIELRTMDDIRADLAVEAEKLLGYGVMRKQMGLQSPLLAVLAKLEIEPFNSASVARYKAEMLAYARVEARRLDAAEHISPDSWNARVAEWRTSSIESYGNPVPEFALEKALQVKRECPEACFEIEELRVVPDPFLIVRLDHTRCYIEVWDEPKFESI